MKKLLLSSIVGLSLVNSLVAKDCIMVPDLNVEFKNNSTIYMNNDEKQEIIEFSQFLKESGLYAVIEGHTSKFAPANYNYELSVDRAYKVRDELIKLGVSSKQVDAIGFGESSPLYDNNTEIGAQKNRRVIAEVFTSVVELNDYVDTESDRISKIKLNEQ